MRRSNAVGDTSPAARDDYNEPEGLFPPLVRPRVFRWIWAVLILLVVALAVLAVEYGRLSDR